MIIKIKKVYRYECMNCSKACNKIIVGMGRGRTPLYCSDNCRKRYFMRKIKRIDPEKFKVYDLKAKEGKKRWKRKAIVENKCLECGRLNDRYKEGLKSCSICAENKDNRR